MMEVLEACGNDIDMYSGDDQQIVPLMSLGAIGVISVFSNVMPAEAHRITKLCLDGDFKTAAELQLKYLRLMNGLFMQVNPIPVKTAMAKLGFCENEFRMPLCPMEACDDEKLFALMREQNLIK